MSTRKWITDEVIILLDEGCEISLDKDFARYYSKKGDTYNFIFPNSEIEYSASQLIDMVRHLDFAETLYYIRRKKKFGLKLISSNTDKVSMGKGFKGNEERVRADRKRANDKIKRSLGIRTK